ncbi:MAG: tRNA uridine(34) 5-carboxymethylaminomethyl modification radical SAM/GNAT enzyme Elp3 [bacterium]
MNKISFDLINKEIILKSLELKPQNRRDFLVMSNKILGKYKINNTPTNFELLQAYHKILEEKKYKANLKLEDILRIKKTRSLSGVVVVSVLTKPYPCPGNCLYCPTQKGMPKSYLKNEPAVMRAILNKFDPYLQTTNRLRALKCSGHPTDKINLRTVGGTWSYYPKNYQTWFIKKIFEACNNFQKKTKIKSNLPLENLQEINERVKTRIVQISVETRPDYINQKEIKRMRKLGITKVELGVQTLDDKVLKINNRGHGVEITKKATVLLKDAGFKIAYQMMLNLPGSSISKDLGTFKELFQNQAYRPDYLKIYPLAIVKEASVYKLYKQGKFKPYSKDQLIKLIANIKKELPYYTRVERVIRDIPSQEIIAGGSQLSNMREYIVRYMEKENLKCKCIRCREVRDTYSDKDKPILYREDYDSSGGKEIFLSFENKNRTKLFSILKLRIPAKPFLKVLKQAGIIREIRTYGQQIPFSNKSKNAIQHKGLGKEILKQAERIAFDEFDVKKMIVISGIGVRDYFRKLGYKLSDTYMVKNIKNYVKIKV